MTAGKALAGRLVINVKLTYSFYVSII